jgi:hypothetical protein
LDLGLLVVLRQRGRETYHAHIDVLGVGDVVLVEHRMLGCGAIKPTWTLGLDKYAYDF